MTAPIPARPADCLCPWEEEDPACPADHTRLCHCGRYALHIGADLCAKVAAVKRANQADSLSALAVAGYTESTATPVLRVVRTMAEDGVPDPPGMVWRGAHPADREPVAIVDTLDGKRAVYWNQMGSQWVTTHSLPAASLIFATAFASERDRASRAEACHAETFVALSAAQDKVERITTELTVEVERLRAERARADARADAAEAALAKALEAVRLT